MRTSRLVTHDNSSCNHEENSQTAMCTHVVRVSGTKQQLRQRGNTHGLYNQIHISATGTATTYNIKRLTGYQNERPDVVSYTSLNMGK